MDGLTDAASGIAVVSLAFQLADSVKKLCDFWNSIKEAPEDVREIAMDLDLLSSVLAEIAQEAQHIEPDTSFVNALSRCSVQVRRLHTLLKEIEPGFSSASLRSRKWTAFKAVLKHGHFTKFQIALDRLKATLLLVQQNMYSRLVRTRSIFLEQNLVEITQNISSSNIKHQSQAAKKCESLALHTRSNYTGSAEDKWDTTEFYAESLQTDKIKNLIPNGYLPEQSYTRCVISEERSIMNSFLGTFRTVSRTRLQKLKEVDDQPDHYAEDEYEHETVYTIHPAPWLVRLGVGYGFNARLLSSSTQGLKNALIDTVRLVPDDALIFEFCRQGNVPAVRSLFSRGLASVRDTTSRGWTPLHFAAMNHHPELCKLLRGASADVNALTHDGRLRTPMEHAVINSLNVTFDTIAKAFDTLRLLADSMDFLDENGDGWELSDWLCSYPEHDFYDREALAALRLRMLRLLSFNLKTYFVKKRFAQLLSSTLTSDCAIEDAVDLLMNLGGTKIIGTVQNDMESSYVTNESPLLHACIMFSNGYGTGKLLTHGPDLHQLDFDCRLTPQEESPTSLAMYTSWAFANWLHQLVSMKVDLVEFAREELKRNFIVHPGWSEQSLVSLFEFGYKPDLDPRFSECDDCGGWWHARVQPHWRHLLERIKQRIEPDMLVNINSEEDKEEIVNAYHNVKGTSTLNDQAQCDESLGSFRADDLSELSAGSDGEFASVSGPYTVPDTHEYPANALLRADCLYAKEEFVCFECWQFYIGTGTRRIISDENQTSISGDDASEGDFTPYLIHS